MKVIRVGRTAAEKFIGKTLTCRVCGTAVEVEAADATRVLYDSDQRDGGYYLPWDCPHCGQSQRAYEAGTAEQYYGR